jgi:predicted nucleic acid-binding protein
MIVVDSSSIISLAVNCLCPIIHDLNVPFVITPRVYSEIITRPSSNKRFMLEAMRIQRLLDSGAVSVKKPKTDLGDKIAKAANQIYRIHGKPLKIIHEAEAEAIGLALELSADALLIDERTTRLVMESPKQLSELLSYRNKAKVKMDEAALSRFKSILPKTPVIRSAEIVAVAYERGLLTSMHGVEDKSVFEAALNALKFSGCAITWDEIEEYKKAVI